MSGHETDPAFKEHKKMTEDLIEYRGLLVRAGTSDRALSAGVPREYGRLEPEQGDTILDIGACLGAFTVWAGKLGAHVIACEPVLDNFDLLKKNVARNGLKSVCLPVAVVRAEDVTTLPIYLSNRSHGAHHLKPTRGRTAVNVKATSISKLLAKYKPNKLKVDCEGEEYPLFLDNVLPKHVKRIAFELHLNKMRSNRAQARQLDKELLKQGFKHIGKPPTIGDKNFHTIGAYGRP